MNVLLEQADGVLFSTNTKPQVNAMQRAGDAAASGTVPLFSLANLIPQDAL